MHLRFNARATGAVDREAPFYPPAALLSRMAAGGAFRPVWDGSAGQSAVMRGVGRLKDAGVESVWGPGRHGPGNNVFAYYVAPFGAVIEYTSEIQRVGAGYKVGGPDDWKWPPGRTDHWCLSKRDDAKLHAVERNYRFRPL